MDEISLILPQIRSLFPKMCPLYQQLGCPTVEEDAKCNYVYLILQSQYQITTITTRDVNNESIID